MASLLQDWGQLHERAELLQVLADYATSAMHADYILGRCINAALQHYINITNAYIKLSYILRGKIKHAAPHGGFVAVV